jgi:hypothetical protein
MDNIVSQPSMQEFIYEIDQMATSDGNSVLRLPPYHWHDDFGFQNIFKKLVIYFLYISVLIFSAT